MHISKVQIRNFRNLRDFEVELSEKAILLGENGTGKTNFIEALRFVLDQSYRPQFSATDFSHGLTQFRGTRIEVHLWFSGFDQEADKDLLAVAHDCRVSGEDEPIQVKLSAVYEPRPNVLPENAVGEDHYDVIRYARDDRTTTQAASRFRSFVRLVSVPAIRDLDRDMQSWRLSPMRRMLELMSLTQNEDFKQVAQQVKSASERIQGIAPIKKLQDDIRDVLGEIVEEERTIDPRIGLSPSNPDDLQRMLTIFVEMGLSIDRSSLGLTNVLYLITWLVYLDRLRTSTKPGHQAQFTILVIEEPEAHLHPHLQRLVFRNVFARNLPILVSTHSPTIVSLAQPDWFTIFKRSARGTVAVSTSKLAQMDEKLRRDLHRFLDANRGEVVFARGVLLVEGDAEIFLVPEMARKLKEAGKIPHSLDGAGVSVCSVYGTDFGPHIKFLGPLGLDLPFAILTDGDPDDKISTVNLNGRTNYEGLRRGIKLAKQIDEPAGKALEASYATRGWEEVWNSLERTGIFVNRRTLEDELIKVGYPKQFLEVYEELGASPAQLQNMEQDINNGDIVGVIKRIERTGMGKGRFAQRLADRIDAGKVPAYIEKAICHVLQRVPLPESGQAPFLGNSIEPTTDAVGID